MLGLENLKRQFVLLFPTLLVCFIPAILLVVSVLIVCITTETSLNELIQDPAQTVGFPRYIGLISNIGILFWAFSSAICIFSYFTLRNKAMADDQVVFLLVFGVVNLI